MLSSKGLYSFLPVTREVILVKGSVSLCYTVAIGDAQLVGNFGDIFC